MKGEKIEFWWWYLLDLVLTHSLGKKSALGYFAKPSTGDYNFLYFAYEDFTLHNYMKILANRCVFSIAFHRAS